jgi:hypothetical protein
VVGKVLENNVSPVSLQAALSISISPCSITFEPADTGFSACNLRASKEFLFGVLASAVQNKLTRKFMIRMAKMGIVFTPGGLILF